MIVADTHGDTELLLNQFRRLLRELMRGATTRNVFEPWEIDIMLDFQACDVPPRRRMETLTQYERAVKRQLAVGAGPPMKLSEFLAERERRRAERRGDD